MVPVHLRGASAGENGAPHDARRGRRGQLRACEALGSRDLADVDAGLGVGDVMGRSIELDDLKSKRIRDALQEGNSRACAARLAGVHETTLRRWVRMGKTGQEPYRSFRSGVLEAEAKAEEMMVAAIKGAAMSGAPGTWQAAKYWLTVRRNDDWREPEPVDQGPVDLSQVSSDVLEQAVKAAQDMKARKHG